MTIVKVIEYNLADGIDDASFLAVSAEVTPELAKMNGFIKRELQKGEDGRWRDIVYWKSRKDADDSDELISRVSVCTTCIGMMQHSDMSIEHFELQQS